MSRRFNDDGQTWVAGDGTTTLHEACLNADAQHQQQLDDPAGAKDRYLFPDGSAIIACPQGWDLEGSEPWSWRGVE